MIGLTPSVWAVTPLYGGAPGWNDYIRNDGPSLLTASGVACDGTETALHDTCLHGGEMRQFQVSGEASCTGITAVDTLDAFDWICDEATNPVRVVSTGLKQGRRLSDLIDFGSLAWKANGVTITTPSQTLASTPSAWWSNPIVGGNVGGAFTQSGSVYAITAQPAALISIDGMDKVAVVTQPGLMLARTGGLGAASVMLLNSKFSWVEASVDGAGNSYGIVFQNTRFSVVRGADLSNTDQNDFDNEIYAVGLMMAASSGNRISNIDAHNNGAAGMLLVAGSNGNRVSGLNATDNGFIGLALLGASGNQLNDITASSNGEDGVIVEDGADNNTFTGVVAVGNGSTGIDEEGINIYDASGNRFFQIVVADNGSDGFLIDGNSLGNTVADLRAFNNSGKGIEIDGPSKDNTLMGITAFANGDNGVNLWDTVDNRLLNVTSVNNGKDGIFIGQSTHNLLARIVTANNGELGINFCCASGSQNLIVDLAAAHNEQHGVMTDSTNANIFSGLLKVGGNRGWDGVDGFPQCWGSVGSGLLTSCLNDGASDALLSSGINLADSLVGRLYVDDAANPDDQDGAADYAGINDWSSFENAWRGWGLAGYGLFPADNQNGRCQAGGNCRIWDLTLRSMDGGDSGWPVLQEVLPLPDGNDTRTHNRSDGSTTTFLKAAGEILGDGVGDEDGLCESNETCIYNPNIGSYQSVGNASGSANIGTGGALVNIQLVNGDLPPGVLDVSPGDAQAIGLPGGPYQPSSLVFQLQNTGGSPLDYSVSKTADWFELANATGRLSAGETADITLTFNAAAGSLLEGVHQDTLTFSNLSGGVGSAIRGVGLTISQGALYIQSAEDLSLIGPVGGPFTATRTFILSNPGGNAVDWSAATTAVWADLSQTGGTLAPWQNTSVTLSVNAIADTYSLDSYPGTLTFTNTTTGVGTDTVDIDLTVAEPGVLTVYPAGGIDTTAPEGGPFIMTRAYTLSNSGDAPIEYQVTGDVSWLQFQAQTDGGMTNVDSSLTESLAAGESHLLLVTLGTFAETLSEGVYHGMISFNELTRGLGNTSRAVTLEITPPASPFDMRFERIWPTLPKPWYFSGPNQMAVDRDGFIYMADTGLNLIRRFSPDGRLVTQWGGSGSEPGMFDFPSGVALDSLGNVYVADTNNQRIQKFTADGKFISEWGEFGSGDGQFFGIWNLAIDANDYLYATDNYLNRIQVFTPDGGYVRQWGTTGSGDGQFQSLGGIVAHQNGYIYTVDMGNDRVQKFSREGFFIGQWGGTGSGEGWFQFMLPGKNDASGVTVDANGTLYVADTGNDRIQSFDEDGNFLSAWGSSGSGDGQFILAGAIVADGNGSILVGDLGRIQRFTTDGSFTGKWTGKGSRDGLFDFPVDVATAADGALYVTDLLNHRVQKFSADGVHQLSWGSLGSGFGQFNEPGGIAVNGNTVYVADKNNARIQRFDTDGNYLGQWGVPGSGEGQFLLPAGVDTDSAGNVYVADAGNNRIQKFDAAGVYLDQWGGTGNGIGQFDQPWDVAIDANDRLYVTDNGNNRVQKFDTDGAFLGSWGEPAYGPNNPQGSFDGPRGIAVDVLDRVYVVDAGNDRVQVFGSNGEFIQLLGGLGYGPQLLNEPTGIEMGLDGKLYIADTKNDRVQSFDPALPPNNTRAIIIAGGGPYADNKLWAATQAMANKAYNALLHQGFIRENIHYISATASLDLDGNGLQDEVDADLSRQSIQDAITQWASADDDGDGSPDAEDVVVYATDHGGSDLFRVNAVEMLSSGDLDSWLTTLEGEISGNVTLIYDACQSGSFSPISHSRRRVITSSGENEAAEFTGSGLLSFSDTFWMKIQNGNSIGDAYSAAWQGILKTPGAQSPQLDADGDQGLNTGYSVTGEPIEPAFGDYLVLHNEFIGSGTHNFLQGPVIDSASASNLTGSSARISAHGVTDSDGINQVWAVVYPPNLPPQDLENPLTGLPTLDLIADDLIAGDYSVGYAGFTSPGLYKIVISATDSLGNTSPPIDTSLNVGNPVSRKAIIVIGGEISDPHWPVREETGSIAYMALKQQGYADSDIEYLSPSNVNGVEKLVTRDNLAFAITNWSAGNTQDLTLFLVGDSDGVSFRLNDSQGPGGTPEHLTADDLDGWLDILQDPGQGALPGKVTVIMDADNAGFYLGRLSTPAGLDEKRIRIASTLAGKARIESGGSVSYSKFFWGEIANGKQLPVAHLHAKQAMNGTTGNRQQAWLDSNSDDTGDKYDISRILHYSLGPGILLAGDAPVLGSAGIDAVDLYGDPMQLNLWVEGVTTTGTLAQVWAQVTDPDIDGFGGAEPVSEKVVLTDTGSRYEALYALPGALGGTYTASFYAQDNEGAVSIPLTASATRMDDYEVDNSDGQAKPIIVDDPAQYHSFHTVTDEDWVTFTADAGKSYTIKADPVGEEADIILQLIGPDGTGIDITVDDVPAGEQPLGAEVHIQSVYYNSDQDRNDGIYKVRVRLNTTVTNQPSDYTLAVTTDGGGSGSTSVAGQIRDADGNGVGLAFVKVTGTGETNGSSSTFSLTPAGDYSLGDGPGTYELSASKAGYTLQSPLAVTIPETGTTIAHLTLVADVMDSDGDGVFDNADNCTELPNADQLDTNGDGIGNLCDCDFNQDNFCGGPDFTIFVGCFNSPTNGDPQCEAADMNGDGFVGGPDFTRFITGFNGAPGPAAP